MKIPAISAFIAREIERLETVHVEPERLTRDWDRLNEFFRAAVGEAWK